MFTFCLPYIMGMSTFCKPQKFGPCPASRLLCVITKTLVLPPGSLPSKFTSMCQVCHLNTTRAEAFANEMMSLLNHGALSLMVSIGHRTGLFDTMRQLPPATYRTIAKEAGLNERYVQEWLGAMVSGRIVEYHPQPDTYELPREHAAYLTRAAGADNVAVFTQYISTLGQVEDDIVRCFQQGGGVPYEKFPRFHEVMREDSGLAVVPMLIDEILPLIPNSVSHLTEGIRVLDVGCGSGRALNLMAQHFPASEFVGYDLCEEPLSVARQEARVQGLTNVYFEQKDLTRYQPEARFNLITAFDAIHDQARPDLVLQRIYQALDEDGHFLMVDINASSKVENNIDHPIAPLLYTLSTMHCMTVSLAQNGMGLGAMWGREAANRLLREAGFRQVSEYLIERDFQNRYFVIRK